jgi:hypothetical protein
MKFLKVLGWIFAPFIMIPLKFERFGSIGKAVGAIWTVLLWIFIVTYVNVSQNTSAKLRHQNEVAVVDKLLQEDDVTVEDRSKRADEFVSSLRNGLSRFSLPILDAYLNEDTKGQFWVEVPSEKSSYQIVRFGKEIVMDYYHEVGYPYSDVVIVDKSQKRAEVIYHAVKDKFEVKLP